MGTRVCAGNRCALTEGGSRDQCRPIPWRPGPSSRRCRGGTRLGQRYRVARIRVVGRRYSLAVKYRRAIEGDSRSAGSDSGPLQCLSCAQRGGGPSVGGEAPIEFMKGQTTDCARPGPNKPGCRDPRERDGPSSASVIPLPPMRRVHVDPFLGLRVDPSIKRATARKHQRVRTVALDDGELKITTVWRSGYGLPHSKLLRRLNSRYLDLDHTSS